MKARIKISREQLISLNWGFDTETDESWKEFVLRVDTSSKEFPLMFCLVDDELNEDIHLGEYEFASMEETLQELIDNNIISHPFTGHVYYNDFMAQTSTPIQRSEVAEIMGVSQLEVCLYSAADLANIQDTYGFSLDPDFDIEYA